MLLLIDNFDSFTYNLADYLYRVGVEVKVVRNNAIDIVGIEVLAPKAIMISPGPGRPADAGITPEVVSHFHDKLPILGICLGMQAIGEYFGAQLVHAPDPVHGKTSQIKCEPNELFNGMPANIEVMRYHSLVLQHLPDSLKPLAATTDGLLMAMQHNSLPLYGLQFHPESIMTTQGLKILDNWAKLAMLA